MNEVEEFMSFANWQRNLLSSCCQAYDIEVSISDLINEAYSFDPFIWVQVLEADWVRDVSYHSTNIPNSNIKPNGILGMAEIAIGCDFRPRECHCSKDAESHLLFSRCLYYVIESIIFNSERESSLNGEEYAIGFKARGKGLIELLKGTNRVIHFTFLRWDVGERNYKYFKVAITFTDGYVTGVSVSPVQQVLTNQPSLSETIQSFRSSPDQMSLDSRMGVRREDIEDEILR